MFWNKREEPLPTVDKETKRGLGGFFNEERN